MDDSSAFLADNAFGQSSYAVSVRGEGAAEQLVIVEPNTTYQLRGFTRVSNDGQKAYLGVKDYDRGSFSDAEITSPAYEEATVTFTTGSGSTTALIYYHVAASGTTAFGDDFELSLAPDSN